MKIRLSSVESILKKEVRGLASNLQCFTLIRTDYDAGNECLRYTFELVNIFLLGMLSTGNSDAFSHHSLEIVAFQEEDMLDSPDDVGKQALNYSSTFAFA